uniref:Cyclin E1 n=1 Tax=Pavo cristatus TaxID=9049 RepID=A0A8C9G699_PAVCR
MRRESDCAEEKAPAKGEGGAEGAVRARKRKADVATFLQDPDEEIAKIEMSRKKQYKNQLSWNNINKDPHMLIPTPDKDDDPVGVDYSHFIHLNVASIRSSPLPILGWANRDDVWKNMINKEETYVRDKLYMQRHPLLQPKMRTILLDWLMEVSFFGSVTTLNVLLLKYEIYPPKLHQFAYVTDGACTEDEILSMELIIMKALNWNLNPLTVVSWLNIYMQVAYLNELYEVLLPQYPQQIFVQIAELLDLCVLDIGCLEYTYGVLAASALYHFSSSELMQKVSGYEWCEIEECVKWMVPFAMAIREVGSSKLKHFRGVAPEDLHNIQTHINSLDLLDKAQAKQAILAEQNRTSPFPTGVLTPPQSSKKQPAGLKPI